MSQNVSKAVVPPTTAHMTMDTSLLDVAASSHEDAAEVQEAVRDPQLKILVTTAVELIISIRLVLKSKYKMMVQPSVYNEYIIVTHYLRRLVALLN